MSYNDPFSRYSASTSDEGLWNKISRFDMDNPISEYGFSTRLAKENFWTKQFTESAIPVVKQYDKTTGDAYAYSDSTSSDSSCSSSGSSCSSCGGCGGGGD